MKWKAYVPLAVALVLGLFAARMAMNLVGVEAPKIIQATSFTPIVVAGRDITAGTVLAETDLSTIKVDSSTVPDNAMLAASAAAGKVVKINLTKGQPILPTVLADEGAGYGIAATLPQGYRLVTVDINEITGVAGFIQPKCRVDIVSTIQNDGKPITKTLLQSVLVFAVGGRTNPTAPVDPQAPASHTVTLLVKPADAERLELASTVTRLRMVLKNGNDNENVGGNGITLAELKGDKSDAANPDGATVQNAADVQPATQPSRGGKLSWSIQVIRGGAASLQTVDIAKPAAPATDAPQKPAAAQLSDISTESIKK